MGFRTGGAGGAGATTAGAGLAATRTAGLAGRTGAVRVDDALAGAVVLTGRRRAAWALFFAGRAGLRAEVRGLDTRRDFAMTSQTGPQGTVANTVVNGQDP